MASYGVAVAMGIQEILNAMGFLFSPRNTKNNIVSDYFVLASFSFLFLFLFRTVHVLIFKGMLSHSFYSFFSMCER
jgi:hypothetical protein